MPLDPEVSRLLKLMEQSGLLPGERLELEAMRKGFAQLSSLIPREKVGSTRDLSFVSGGFEVPCRLYTPLRVETEGLIVFYHGGGFVLGGIEEYDGLCRALANASHTRLLSVAYRLAPEHRFPAAVEDAVAALRYAATHAGELGVSAERMVVAGDSAGGNLAAVASVLTRGELRLRRQVLIYPAVSFDVSSHSAVEYSEGLFLTRAQMEWFGQQYLSSGEQVLDPRFAPMLFPDVSGAPPALIVTAEYDPLRDQGEAYGAKLRAAGVPATVVRVAGMIHGFLSFFGAVKAARDTLNMVGSLIEADLEAD